jgi:hypothetical protein
MRRNLIVLLIAVLCVFAFIESAYAYVTVNNAIKLYYDDGTFIYLGAGTFSSLQRINNIWYVNGALYGGSNVQPISVVNIAYSLYSSLGFMAIIPIVLAASLIFMGIMIFKNQQGTFDIKLLVAFVVASIAVELGSIIAIMVIHSLSSA